MKVVINRCYGGFSLSDAAYEMLIEEGIPVKKYTQEKRGEDGLYSDEPANDGEVIFDRELTPQGEDGLNVLYHKYKGGNSRGVQRYWETWVYKKRDWPLLVKIVKRLGKKANGGCADLKIIEIPDGIEYSIEECDGMEHIAEKHRTWA